MRCGWIPALTLINFIMESSVYFVAFFVLPGVAFSISCNSSSLLNSGAKRVFPSAIVSPAKKNSTRFNF